jgi:hypothetical protein
MSNRTHSVTISEDIHRGLMLMAKVGLEHKLHEVDNQQDCTDFVHALVWLETEARIPDMIAEALK